MKLIFDSSNFVIISKPAGMVVHPGAGNETETVSKWLITHYPEVKKHQWKTSTRIGIVHRLDKETSGIMVLAKNPKMLDYLQNQFRERQVEKFYTALAYGKTGDHGAIRALIGKDPKDRKKQKVQLLDFGLDEREKKSSATEYWVKKRFTYKKENLTLLNIKIYTGRKHQIRTHLNYINHPVIGDKTYCNKPSKRISSKLGLKRQFLHSTKISFRDTSKEIVTFEDSLPDELQKIIEKLNEVV